jgi:hypothetical protein
MKKLFYLLLAATLPVMALAQAPNNFNYQAVVPYYFKKHRTKPQQRMEWLVAL